MARVGFLIDDRFRLHETGSRHHESPNRLAYIRQAIDAFGAAERWRRIEARSAKPDQLELIHRLSHIERVRRASDMAPSFLDMDTPVSIRSFDTALLAAGCN